MGLGKQTTAIWSFSSNPIDCSHGSCIPWTLLGTEELAQSTAFLSLQEVGLSRHLHMLLKEDPKEDPAPKEQAVDCIWSCPSASGTPPDPGREQSWPLPPCPLPAEGVRVRPICLLLVAFSQAAFFFSLLTNNPCFNWAPAHHNYFLIHPCLLSAYQRAVHQI